jgi:hypothetical protein
MTDFSKWTDEQLEARRQELLGQKSRLEGSVVNKQPAAPLPADRSFYARNVDPFGMEVAKGVPIAGGAVTQTPDMTDFENRHPYVAGAANAAGTLAGMAPISRAGTALVEGLPWAARAFGGITGNAGVAAADAKARGASNDDAGMAVLLAAALHGGQTVGSKLISPGLSDTAANNVAGALSRGASAGVGHAIGAPFGASEPALMGLLMGEDVFKGAFKPWLKNTAAQDFASGPMTNAIAPTATQWGTQRALANALTDQGNQNGQ